MENSNATQVLTKGGKRELSVIAAPIEMLPYRVGALVSSDDNYLSHGGGLSLRLWDAGRLEDVVKPSERRELHLGDVFVSAAGRLNADHLLHAITIDFDTGQRIASGSPTALVRSVLATAERLGCKSVALPMLGTGAAGLEMDEFLRSFATAVTTWAEGPSSLEKVYLVVLPREANTALATLNAELPAVEWAENTVAALPPELADLGIEWILGAEFPIEDRNILLIVFEELCRRVAILTGALGQNEAASVSGRDVIVKLHDKLDEATLYAVEETWLTRNQVSHSSQVFAVDAIDKINHGIKLLLRWTRDNLAKSEATTSVGSPFAGAAVSSALGVLAGGSPLGAIGILASSLINRNQVAMRNVPKGDAVAQSSPAPTEEATAIAFSGDSNHAMWTGADVSTTPLRELRSFVDQQLKGKARQAFFQKLTDDSYSGPDQIRILEFLIREPELDRWVANEFHYHTLQNALAARGVKTSSSDRESLARQLLESLGFPSARKFKGIENVLRDLENISNELLLPQTDYDGSVTRASKLLEYVAKVLIRFLSQAAFHEAPDIYLRNAGQLKPDLRVADCTLGALLQFVGYLANTIEKDTTTLSVQTFKRVLDRPNPLPKEMQELAGVRNSFLHYKEAASNELDATRRKLARNFARDASDFVKALNGGGIGLFPVIVRVDSITIDKWGRRTVAAFREGHRRETIFTDQSLEPGRVYFMHPLSNPLRVDPILVPAGEVWIED